MTRENLSNVCWYKPARKTTIAGCQYMYQPPNALVGEATCAFFNIPKLNESLPFFKMVEKKNSWLFTSVNSFRVFSPYKKKSHHMKWKILWDFGLGIQDPLVLHKKGWEGNSVKKSDIANWRMLPHIVVQSSSHV